VASGGVPLPEMPARGNPPLFGGQGPTGGNAAYPEGSNAPTVRYASGYNVMSSQTKPPYTTLTAYDLNTGEIKWQVGNGDDLQTLRAGGPAGTGGVGARNGVVVTKGGIVFHAGGDNKVRAYDEDTGKVLWTGSLPGNASGVPFGYESKGRQYFGLIAGGAGGGRGGGGGAGRGGEGAAPGQPAIKEHVEGEHQSDSHQHPAPGVRPQFAEPVAPHLCPRRRQRHERVPSECIG
jgi:hypothetical protein